MKKYVFLAFIIYCCCPAIASPNEYTSQNFSVNKPVTGNTLNQIIRKLKKANVFDATPLRVKNPGVSEQESLYKELLSIATPEELTELSVNNKNAVVRLYAFRALMEKMKDAPGNVIQQFMKDTTPIKVVDGNSSTIKPMNSISNGFLY